MNTPSTVSHLMDLSRDDWGGARKGGGGVVAVQGM